MRLTMCRLPQPEPGHNTSTQYIHANNKFMFFFVFFTKLHLSSEYSQIYTQDQGKSMYSRGVQSYRLA